MTTVTMPTTVDVDRQIEDAETQASAMAKRRAGLKLLIGQSGGDTSHYEAEYNSLGAKLDAANDKIDRLREQRGDAVRQDAVDNYRAALAERDTLRPALEDWDRRFAEAQAAINALQNERPALKDRLNYANARVRRAEDAIRASGILPTKDMLAVKGEYPAVPSGWQ